MVQLCHGVKQCNLVFPWLFNVVVEKLLNMIPQCLGAQYKDAHFTVLAYADDIIFADL